MFRSHLRIAVRNLLGNKLFSIVNISGLAIGIACSLLLFMFVRDELSFDRSHKNANEIYRAYLQLKINGKESVNGKTAAPLGPTMVKDFPEVVDYSRVGYLERMIFALVKRYLGKRIYTESIPPSSLFSTIH